MFYRKFFCRSNCLASGGSISVQTQNEEKANTSSQTSYRSLPAKAESSFTTLLVLSPADPLRWALLRFRKALWKPRRELLTPTPSVRSQGASARRLLYATRLVVPLKHPLVKTDKGRIPSRRILEAGSFFASPSFRHLACGRDGGKGASRTPPPT
jgi:hypothetical protein